MTLLLREADVKKLAEMGPVVAAVEAAMRDLGAGLAENQPRRRVFPSGGVLNVMFAAWPAGGLAGLKSYSVAGGKARFLIVLYALDGSVRALVESDWLGTFRTGAATGVAVRALAGPGPHTVAVIGAGWQARTQVLALRSSVEVRELRVFSRDPERRRRFAAENGAIAAADAAKCVRGADVVVTITSSADPVLEADWVGPSAVVVGAGSNYPNRAELPVDLIAGARAVVVDQRETAALESGDLLRAGFDLGRALELGSVLAGRESIPAGPGPVVFESHGLALWDVAAASVVVEAATRAGTGEQVRLFEPEPPTA
ncbi:MAG: ornithine cyclodeaminase family protein [Candidatus Dormibacteraeota bacterium]|nr:ornithine cyclodeaminase family protein [Candidatus Dormibacteraeota bacterium]